MAIALLKGRQTIRWKITMWLNLCKLRASSSVSLPFLMAIWEKKYPLICKSISSPILWRRYSFEFFPISWVYVKRDMEIGKTALAILAKRKFKTHHLNMRLMAWTGTRNWVNGKEQQDFLKLSSQPYKTESYLIWTLKASKLLWLAKITLSQFLNYRHSIIKPLANHKLYFTFFSGRFLDAPRAGNFKSVRENRQGNSGSEPWVGTGWINGCDSYFVHGPRETVGGQCRRLPGCLGQRWDCHSDDCRPWTQLWEGCYWEHRRLCFKLAWYLFWPFPCIYFLYIFQSAS